MTQHARIRCPLGLTLPPIPRGVIGLLLLMLPLGSWGCQKSVRRADPTPPGPTYTGPAFLRGTVGSLTQLRGTKPMLVSGYGLVVNLDNTGSSDVPAFLRGWLINEMRKRGVGSARLSADWMSPEAVLASPKTAVVQVEGLIPPGASKGTRFDVWVSALPQTQTTSLEGGQLWTVDLSQGGANTNLLYSRRLAHARGPLYLNPFGNPTSDPNSSALKRQGVVLSGGVASEDRKLELILNQPSWQRSRLIADRINERYPKAPSDRRDTAVPIDDTRIELNVPARYRQSVDEFLDLINHLYTQRGSGFEAAQAQRLAEVLVADPSLAPDVVWAWQSLGKTILPVLGKYYNHPNSGVHLAALESGARLGHELATDQLSQLAQQPDPNLRKQVAAILAHLPGSVRGSRALQKLLDDPDPNVRVQAYESLAAMNDPVLRRIPVDPTGEMKFVLDLVPATQPLIYIAHANIPRIALFNPRLALKVPSLFRYWDNRLMMRTDQPDGRLTLFHQPSGQVDGKTYALTTGVADLITFLAHRPTVENPEDGLDLSYSQVATILDALVKQGILDAGIELQINPLAQAIADAQAQESAPRRPESSPPEVVERSFPPEAPEAPAPSEGLQAPEGPEPRQHPAPPASIADPPAVLPMP